MSEGGYLNTEVFNEILGKATKAYEDYQGAVSAVAGDNFLKTMMEDVEVAILGDGTEGGVKGALAELDKAIEDMASQESLDKWTPIIEKAAELAKTLKEAADSASRISTEGVEETTNTTNTSNSTATSVPNNSGLDFNTLQHRLANYTNQYPGLVAALKNLYDAKERNGLTDSDISYSVA